MGEKNTGRDEVSIEKNVKQAKMGDSDAIRMLYEKTANSSYFVAKKFIKGEQDALDVVQDSYVTAFSKLNQLDDDKKFIQWLNRIIANKAKDYLKKKKPMLFSDITTKDQNVEDFVSDDRLEFSPQKSYDYEELKEAMSKIIDQLSDENRMCILMYYFQQLSITEIATTLEVPENTVKSRLNYGRKQIKKEVQGLESKGIKLNGIMPIPFMVWVLQSTAKAVVVPEVIATQALGAVMGIVGVGSVAAASTLSFAGYTIATATLAKVLTGTAIATVAVVGGVSLTDEKPKEAISATVIQPELPPIDEKIFSYPVIPQEQWIKEPYLSLDSVTPIPLYDKGFLIQKNNKHEFIGLQGEELLQLDELLKTCADNDTFATEKTDLNGEESYEYLSSMLGIINHPGKFCHSILAVPGPELSYSSADKKIYMLEPGLVDEENIWKEVVPSEAWRGFTRFVAVDAIGEKQKFQDKNNGYIVAVDGSPVSHNIYSEYRTTKHLNLFDLPQISNLGAIKKNGKWKMISKDGTNLTKPIYDDITILNENYAMFKLKEEVGLLDNTGNVIFKGKYEEISAPMQNTVMVKVKGLWGILTF